MWKWRVALLCAMINMQHMGQKKVIGQMFVATRDRFDVNRTQTALALIIGVVIYNLCGPLVGLMSNKFGLKRTTVCGCALASLSIAACSLADNITSFTLLWGFPVGISSSMAVFVLPSFIHFHYKKDQAMANGIATAGSSLGGFIFSPLYKIMLDNYGLSGSFLILGALALHSVPAAMLLNNPKSEIETIKNPNIKKETGILDSKNMNNYTLSKSLAERPNDADMKDRDITIKVSTKSSKGIEIKECRSQSSSVKSISRNYVLINQVELKTDALDAKVKASEQNKKDVGEKAETSIEKCTENNIPQNISLCALTKNVENPSTQTNIEADIDVDFKSQRHISKTITPLYNDDGLIKENISVSNASISTEISAADSQAIQQNNNSATREDNTSTTEGSSNTIQQNTNTSTREHNSSTTEGSGSKTWSVLYDPVFLMVFFITSAHMTMMVTINTIMVDFTLDKGLSIDEGVYTVMCFAISDMVGRFSLGWVTDKGYLSVSSFLAACYATIAILYLVYAHTNSFVGGVVSLTVAGVLTGAAMTLFPVLMSQYFLRRRNVMALASRYLLMAPACFAISPMIGFFRETLGSYVFLFYCLSALCVLCSVITLLTPLVARWRAKKNEPEK